MAIHIVYLRSSDISSEQKFFKDNLSRIGQAYADDTDESIAQFEPAIIGPQARPGTLYLNARGCELQHPVVLTFVIIQRARRKRG